MASRKEASSRGIQRRARGWGNFCRGVDLAPRFRIAIAAALLVLAPGAHGGVKPTATQQCVAAKLLSAGKYSLCRVKADADYAKAGDAAKRDVAYAVCAQRLAAAYRAADLAYGAACATVATDGQVRSVAGQCAASLAALITNLCTNVTCIASDLCHDPGICDPTTGICSNPEKPCQPPGQCEDPTNGLCDPASGRCTYPLLTGTPCDDGNLCTGPDTCLAGTCAAGPAMQCNGAACEPSLGCPPPCDLACRCVSYGNTISLDCESSQRIGGPQGLQSLTRCRDIAVLGGYCEIVQPNANECTGATSHGCTPQ